MDQGERRQVDGGEGAYPLCCATVRGAGEKTDFGSCMSTPRELRPGAWRR